MPNAGSGNSASLLSVNSLSFAFLSLLFLSIQPEACPELKQIPFSLLSLSLQSLPLKLTNFSLATLATILTAMFVLCSFRMSLAFMLAGWLGCFAYAKADA